MALVRFPDPLTWNLGSRLGYPYSGNITLIPNIGNIVLNPRYWQQYVLRLAVFSMAQLLVTQALLYQGNILSLG